MLRRGGNPMLHYLALELIHSTYVSLRKRRYCNCEGTMLMVRDKIARGNRAKGRIKGAGKLVNFVQEEVPLRKGLSTNMNQLGDQKRHMNFNKSEQMVNKGKEVLMKKVIYEKYFNGSQDLRIDKVFMYEEERTTKMYNNISQYLSQKSELSHVDWAIKWKVDGKVGGPPIFEQPKWFKRRS